MDRTRAAIKIIDHSVQAQSETDQQQWRGTPLPSNQPTSESFWHSQTPTPTTPTTTGNSQTSRNKNKTFRRLRRGRQKASSTYKTPKVQRSMKGYIQRTPLSERAQGAPGAPRGGSSSQEGGAASRRKKRDSCNSNRNFLVLLNFLMHQNA